MDLTKFLWYLVILIFLSKAVCMASDVNNVSSSPCEYDWKGYGHHCYKLQTISLDWKNASLKCKKMGGYLASIHSQEQNDFLVQFSIYTSVTQWWIGLRHFRIHDMSSWDDGSDLNFTNWQDVFEFEYNLGDCVYQSRSFLIRGRWRAVPCIRRKPYVCQKEFSTTKPKSNGNSFSHVYMSLETAIDSVYVDNSSLCDDGWKRYDKFCYQGQRIAKNWRNASADCKGLGGHLASIHSKEQNDFLRYFSMETDVPYWFIGLHIHASDGIFVWDDGTDSEYTNWKPGHPSGNNSLKNCVVLSFYSDDLGAWVALSCNFEESYLCQKRVITDLDTEVNHKAFATAVVTEMDDITNPTEIVVTKENDYGYNFISVPNFIITLILVIVFMLLMGGIIYYKTFRVEENRLTVSKVFFKGTESIIEPSTEFIIELK